MHFDGSQHLSLTDLGATLSEAEDLSVRFRTTMADAIIVATRDDASTDKLQVVLGEYIKRFIVFILQVRPTTMSPILIADLFSGFESLSFQFPLMKEESKKNSELLSQCARCTKVMREIFSECLMKRREKEKVVFLYPSSIFWL